MRVAWIVPRICISLVMGLASCALCTWLLLDRAGEASATASDFLVRHGTGVWITGGADATGVHWRNAQQSGRLQTVIDDLGGGEGEWNDGVLQGWCDLSPAPLRTGALAVGWPFPWVIWRFSASESIESFPPNPDGADQVQAMKRAITRILDGAHAPTTTPSTSRVAAIFMVGASMAWWIVICGVLRLRKNRSATPRAASE
ncbi:MAG: hypothetical protein EXS15_02940 [Phycisphaerales bacterium]|nr:hypothetical protein [Phycisphaerales bacterium]